MSDIANMERRLGEVLGRIEPADVAWEERARERIDTLTKPPGSLGRLEDLAARVSAMMRTDRPRAERKRLVLMAGDHGVCAQDVAPYPQAVTQQMVVNIATGGAAISQFVKVTGAELVVADLGVMADVDAPGLLKAKVAYGTADMTEGPAMTRAQALEALLVGIGIAETAADEGVQVLGTGEMGIGNTTPAAALTAAYCDAEPRLCAGRGTGLDDAGVARKAEVIGRALDVNRVADLDPLGVLAAVGGLEIAGLAGVVLGAASRKVPVVIDGYISSAAALAAVRIAPTAADYIVASHQSVEPGHRIVLNAIGVEPHLDLAMRLGEGTGAALTFAIVEAACRMLSDMATFAEAGVSHSDGTDDSNASIA